MKKQLKKYFIPHEENEHKPHFLRNKTTNFILGLVLAVEVFTLVLILPIFPNTLNYLSAVLPSVLISKANDTRAEYNENPLKANDLLTEAAQLKANDMAEKGYFSHQSPDGKTPWYWLNQVGYNYENAGENLAVNFTDSNDVHRAWLESPSHRANILREEYTEIGIATAKGKYKGKDAIFVAQFFGVPKEKILVKAQKPEIELTETNVSLSEEINFGEEEAGIASSATESLVLGETIPEIKTSESKIEKSSLLATIASSPRAVASGILILISLVVAIALLLKILIKFKVQHPRLIANGLILLIFIALLLYFNESFVRVVAEIA